MATPTITHGDHVVISDPWWYVLSLCANGVEFVMFQRFLRSSAHAWIPTPLLPDRDTHVRMLETMTTWNPPPARESLPPWLAVPRWLLLPLAVLPFWAWALWAARDGALVSVLLAGGLALALMSFLAVLVNQRERRIAALERAVEEQRADTAALAERHLPDLVERLRSGDSAETALSRHTLPEDPIHQDLLSAVATEIATAERRRTAAMLACATAAGRVQAMSTAMLADLRRMQDRYGDGTDGGVLGDLMQLDHSIAQTGRVADSIAVLTGARSGRRWSRAIRVESLLRGAMSRIGSYQRVRTHEATGLAVAGFAAEGVIHALAELLDNAAKFSPPTTEVHVHVEEVQAGIAVMIEDAGLVMGDEALRRARAAVDDSLDITSISGTRLGLSVVGHIARRYDLSVSFRTSSRGGTAVVLLIPRKLVKSLSEESALTEHPAEPPAGDEEPFAGHRSRAAAEPPTGDSVKGLPVRRRGHTLAEAGPGPERSAPKAKTPTQSTGGFRAFRTAVRGQAPDATPKDV